MLQKVQTISCDLIFLITRSTVITQGAGAMPCENTGGDHQESTRRLQESSKGPLLGGSWDLVTRVIIKVTTLITTYNPN